MVDLRIIVTVLMIETSFALASDLLKCYDCSDSDVACTSTSTCQSHQNKCLFASLSTVSETVTYIRRCVSERECLINNCKDSCEENQSSFCCECCDQPLCNAVKTTTLGTCESVDNPVGGFTTCSSGHFPDQTLCFLYCVGKDYNLSGKDVFVCDAKSGKWVPEPGTCLTQCSAIEQIANGFSSCANIKTSHNEVCKFSCEENHILVGDGEVTCDGIDGRWNGQPGKCVPFPETCPVVKVDNGISTCSDAVSVSGNICNISCHSGFELTNGETYATCNGETGMWNRNFGTCTDREFAENQLRINNSPLKCYACASTVSNTCDTVDTCSNTRKYCITISKRLVSGTLKITKKCATSMECRASNVNCVNTNSDGTYECFSCCSTNKCNQDDPSPATSSCPTIDHPVNGVSGCADSTTTGGDTCSITCNAGYYLDGNGQISCSGTTGSWGSTPGNCYKTCSAMVPVNGSSTCSGATYDNGVPCDLTCDSGFTALLGATSSVCNGVHGTWNPAFGTCTEDGTCPEFTASNGSKSCTSYKYSDQVQCNVTCGSGFLYDAANPHTCDGDTMTWSPTIGTCNQICESIEINNGNANCDSGTYFNGTLCNVTCNGGYILTGTNAVTCSSGSWHPTPGTCTLGCAPIVLDFGGKSECANETVADEGTCTVTCDDGYTYTGTNQTTVCNGTSSLWQPSVGLCSYFCSAIAISHGGSSTCENSTSLHDDTCNITCTGDYILDGERSVTCDGKTGTWNPSPGTCYTTCDAITVTGGTSTCGSGISNHGQNCTVTCGDGYIINGNNTVTCDGLTGNWSGNLENSCLRICPAFNVTGGNSSCESTISTEGDKCEISCSDGYNAIGSSEGTCGSDGNWGPSLGSCEEEGTCSTISLSFGGNTTCGTGTPIHGKLCSVTCANGFTYTGANTTMACNGTFSAWKPTPGICSDKCPSIAISHGGSSTCESSVSLHDAVCNITCTGDYIVNGERSVTCNGETGKWNKSPGICYTTCDDITVTGGTTTCEVGTADHGQNCTVTCGDGYIINGNDTVTCNGLTGIWSGVLEDSCLKICLAINVTGGNSSCESTISTEGDKCQISCNDGYNAIGSSEGTCGSDGNWSPSLGSCEEEGTCSTIILNFGGNTTCGTGTPIHGTLCNVTCANGYIYTGENTTMTCNGTSSLWEPASGICSDECPSIAVSHGGSSTCESLSSLHDNVCNITCTGNYTLDGEGSVTCDGETGTWNTSPGTCYTNCDDITVTGGTTTCDVGTADHGQNCTVTCGDGYIINGNDTVTCDGLTGNWSGSFEDSCLKICHAINITGGRFSCESTVSTEGVKCEIICNDDYNVIGNSEGTCGSNGNWIPALGSCEEKGTCSTVILSFGGNSTCGTGTPLDGTLCDVTCDNGFTYTGKNTTMICNGTSSLWEPILGICTDKCPSIAVSHGGSTTCESSPSLHDDVCNITCTGDYILDGEGSVTCDGEHGTWNPSPGICYTTCDALTVTGGTTSCSGGTYDHGNNCSLSCNNTYTLKGNDTVNCDGLTGNWIGSLGPCLTTCPSISSPTDGSSSCNSGTTQDGETCTITCDYGYLLSGHPSVQCDGLTGTWDFEAGTCIVDSGKLQCYKCESVTSNDECAELQICHLGDKGSCQTVVHSPDGVTKYITKRCKQTTACHASIRSRNKHHCFTGRGQDKYTCASCCNTTKCNTDLPEPFSAWESESIGNPNNLAAVGSAFSSTLECIYCENEESNSLCNTGVQYCSKENTGCQTFVYKAYDMTSISKSCRDYHECLAEKYELEEMCLDEEDSLCIDCCYEDYCNLELQEETDFQVPFLLNIFQP